MAAQKAVEELSSKGLLEQGGMKTKLQGMKREANNHQTQIEELVQRLSSQKAGTLKLSKNQQKKLSIKLPR